MRKEAGQSVVEFAVALPFLTFVLLGIVDFARVYYLQTALTNAANTGARYAIEVGRDPVDGPAYVQRVIVREAAPVIQIDPNVDIALTATPVWTTGAELRIQVGNFFTPATPLVSGLWGGGPLRVTGTAVARFNPS